MPSETLGDDFLVPADAEVVIEGLHADGQRKPEGPFGEYTRYVGPQRWCPLLKVTAVTRRRDAYWDDVMVGHTHWISSLAKEGESLRARAAGGADVRGRPRADVGLRRVARLYSDPQDRRGTGKDRGCSPPSTPTSSIKHAFVFDEDVDIFDEKEVLLALATRFQADRGLVVVPGINGSPLDPSCARVGVGCKVGFDCTKPLGKPFAERLAISEEVLSRIDPLKIIGEKRWERIPVEPWG